MVLIPELSGLDMLWMRRRKKASEFLGFESRYNYCFETDDDDRRIAVAEFRRKRHRGELLLRLFLARWRPYEVALFDETNTPTLRGFFPFRFYFQHFEIQHPDGRYFGHIERRFGLLSVRFDVVDSKGSLIYSSSSPRWRAWYFPFVRNGREQAAIHRRWPEDARERVTKADRFLIELRDANIFHEHRLLLVMAALFIELMFSRRRSGKKSKKKKKRRPQKPAEMQTEKPAGFPGEGSSEE